MLFSAVMVHECGHQLFQERTSATLSSGNLHALFHLNFDSACGAILYEEASSETVYTCI